MPSHIFTRLGLWDESIQSNTRSASAARCYAESSAQEGHWTSEIHALDYLLYAYLQQGNTEKANEQYEYIKAIKEVWGNNASLAYPFAANPARMALENRDWTLAANIQPPFINISWDQFPWEKSILHFTRALGAVHTNDLVKAENELAILISLQGELVALGDTYKANQVMIQVKAAEAWIHFAKGNHEVATALMRESSALEDATEKHPVTPGEVLPAKELLGDLLLALNRPLEALQAYETNLKNSPNRFNGLYGAAVAAKNGGDMNKATTYFNLLVKLTESSNCDRKELQEAKMFLAKNSS